MTETESGPKKGKKLGEQKERVKFCMHRYWTTFMEAKPAEEYLAKTYLKSQQPLTIDLKRTKK